MAKLIDELIDHSFDGIKEYDNPMPQWWVYLFVLTVIWGGIYMYYYHILEFGPSSGQEYVNEINDYRNKFAAIIQQEESVDWSNPDFEIVLSQELLDKAKILFDQNCVACHGSLGEGGIGPNLTDDYWIHGNGVNNIAKIIAIGVPEKGMIPWKSTFKNKDILALASYVINLHGSNPPNAKTPQGDLYN